MKKYKIKLTILDENDQVMAAGTAASEDIEEVEQKHEIDTLRELKNMLMNEADQKKFRKRIVNAINQFNDKNKKLSWDLQGFNGNESLTGITQVDWNQTLISKLNGVNKEFQGSCIVCSCEVNAIITSLAYFNPPPIGSAQASESNVFYKTGDIKDKYSVYADAYLPGNILMIVKDESFLDDEDTEIECMVLYIENTYPCTESCPNN